MYGNAMIYANAVYEYDKWWMQNDMSLMMPWRYAWCDHGTRQGESTLCPKFWNLTERV